VFIFKKNGLMLRAIRSVNLSACVIQTYFVAGERYVWLPMNITRLNQIKNDLTHNN